MCFSSNVQPRKFSDIPCTIEAGHSKAIASSGFFDQSWRDAKGKSDCNLRPSTRCPTAGWLQIFALAGAIEVPKCVFVSMNDRMPVKNGKVNWWSNEFYHLVKAEMAKPLRVWITERPRMWPSQPTMATHHSGARSTSSRAEARVEVD